MSQDSFEGCNFVDASRGYHNYTFHLKGYTNSFKIKADFLGGFKYSDFIQIPKNRELTVAISTTDLSKLNLTNDYLFVYSIEDERTVFLDSKYSIKTQNSSSDYFFFSGLFLAGLASVYFGYKTKIKTNIF